MAEGARISGVDCTLYGPASELPGSDRVVDAPLAVGNDEEPAHAVRANPDASS